MQRSLWLFVLSACAQTKDVSTDAVALVDATPITEVAPLAADPPVVVPDIGDTAEVEPLYAFYELRHGETLAHFARWSGIPVEEIAEASGLDLAGDYSVGTAIRIPIHSVDTQLAVDERRETHRTRRVETYLASRGGTVGTDFFTVRTGDTAWSIARDAQGIPVWMLEAYNPSVDLDKLQPGQDLLVPVIADIVVDAE